MSYLALVDWFVKFDSGLEIQPGEVRDVGCDPRHFFRADRAEAEPEIDYDAFVVEAATVGEEIQIRGARSARDFLAQIRRSTDRAEGEREKDPLPFSVCATGARIVLRVRNVGEKPERFAVVLRGKAVQ